MFSWCEWGIRLAVCDAGYTKWAFVSHTTDPSTIYCTRVIIRGDRKSRISGSTSRSSRFQWLASTMHQLPIQPPRRRMLCGCYAPINVKPEGGGGGRETHGNRDFDRTSRPHGGEFGMVAILDNRESLETSRHLGKYPDGIWMNFPRSRFRW